MGLKFGVVSGVDAAKGLVRVKFDDNEGMESWWLPVASPFTLKNKAYLMPQAGEHVACMMDDNCEAGVVVGAIYSEADKPPVDDAGKFHVLFEDGTFLEYDTKEHLLKAEVHGAVELKAEKSVRVESDEELLLVGRERIVMRAPRIEWLPLEGESDCEAEVAANFRLRGALRHEGLYDHEGDQVNKGNVTATGTIMDESGNSNHHAH